VTRLNAPLTNPLAGRGVQYTPYRLPRGEIEFPTPDLPDKPGFLDKILGMKDLGDVVVLHDNPETTYYVVTPMSRRFEPLPGEFQAVYKKSTAMFDADPLINIFDYERRGKQLDEVTKQLRAEAKFKPNEENLKMVVERPGD
jgi:hypothetical protein